MVLGFNQDQVEELITDTNLTNVGKIDRLLHLDCQMYTNLNINSTQEDRDYIKQQSRIIYEKIKEINPNLGESLLKAMDI